MKRIILALFAVAVSAIAAKAQDSFLNEDSFPTPGYYKYNEWTFSVLSRGDVGVIVLNDNPGPLGKWGGDFGFVATDVRYRPNLSNIVLSLGISLDFSIFALSGSNTFDQDFNVIRIPEEWRHVNSGYERVTGYLPFSYTHEFGDFKVVLQTAPGISTTTAKASYVLKDFEGTGRSHDREYRDNWYSGFEWANSIYFYYKHFGIYASFRSGDRSWNYLGSGPRYNAISFGLTVCY